MEGSTGANKQYGMKQCNRWDDDGTCYVITFGDLK